jgi:hypothetical protein
VLLSLWWLVLGGAHATKFLVGNLPTPLNSTGLRVVDLVHPSSSFGFFYDLTLESSPARTSYPPGAGLQVQLASNGKTRLVLFRGSHPPASRRSALLDLLRGRARLQVVPDCGWVDLGPPPAAGVRREVQLVGLLPGPFGFAELNTPAERPALVRLEIRRPDAVDGAVSTTATRYRVIAPSPVAAGEVLARFFFFVRLSRVLQVTAALALVLLAVGWKSLSRGEAAKAVCCLIPSVVLLHAVVLPPLQGADETSHMATVEKIVFGEVPPKLDTYPRSISLVAQALEQDRVQFHPDEPLPLKRPVDRLRLRRTLEENFAKEALQNGSSPPMAAVQAIGSRSPLFFTAFRIPAPLLRRFSILDRVSLYRLLATAFGLLLFCGGAWLLYRAQLSEQVILLYGLVFLVPYMVIVTASCSNYAPAIGLGSLLAAAVLTAILTPLGLWKAVAAALLVLASWIGVPIWPDFIFVAIASTVTVIAWGIDRLIRIPSEKVSRALRLIAAAGLVILVLAVAVGSSRLKGRGIGTRTPLEIPRWGSRELTLMVLVAAAPFLFSVGAALSVLRFGRKGLSEAGRLLRRVSIGLALILVAGFLLTPYTTVPYERIRLDFEQLVGAHNLSFWSNNLSWDQDRLFWKFYWGAFGWHDAFYPDWLYALARWSCVGVFLALPVLCARFVAERSRSSALLLLVSGIAISLCVVTEILRYLAPTNPLGRFILPYLPLAAVPILVQAEAPGRERVLRGALGLGTALHVWTSISLVAARYLFAT